MRPRSNRYNVGVRPTVLLAAAALGTAAFAFGSAREPASSAQVDRFDGRAAYGWVRRQVGFGPRPAGSPASRRLGVALRAALPRGRFQSVPGGLRNVIGVIPGRQPGRVVVVGAHYDTKDMPGFVGANDGGSGVAVAVQLARTIKPRTVRPTLVFILFDGEESPAGTPDGEFEKRGLRGSKVAARTYRHAEAMVLLDMVGDRELAIPREEFSNRRLWGRLRTASQRVGRGRTFPPTTQGSILDDHIPFLRAGIPAIDVIDFDFPCWHRRCDTMSAVSAESLDAVGESVLELLRGL